METGKNLERKLQETLLAKQAEAKRDGPPKLPKAFKVLYTLSLYATFIAFGICRGLYGPTLGELQLLTGEPLSKISSVFTWAGTGGILGSLTYGFLFDRFPSLPLFIASLMCWGAFTAVIPWCSNLPYMMGVFGAQAFIFMGIAVGCNVVILRLWRRRSSPALLGMHVLFTFGCFLAPIIAAPFLTEAGDPRSLSLLSQTNRNNATGLHRADSNTHHENAAFSNRNDIERALQANVSRQLAHLEQTSSDIEQTEYLHDSQVYKAYLIVAAYIELIAIFDIILYVIYRHYQISPNQEVNVDLPKVQNLRWVKYFSWFLIFCFNVCFGGAESIYMGLLFTFANVHVGMSNLDSSHLVAGTFAAFGAGRLLSLFLAQCLHVRVIIPLYLLCAISGSAVIAYFVDSSALVLWICSVIVFVGIGPMFGSGLIWAKDFVTVTGRFASTYVLAYTIGMMSFPVLTGRLLETSGSYWFPYIATGLLVVCVVISFILWTIYCAFKTDKKQDKISHIGERQVDEEEGIFASMRSLHTI